MEIAETKLGHLNAFNFSVLTGETLQISKPGNIIACMIPRMFRAILANISMKDIILTHYHRQTLAKDLRILSAVVEPLTLRSLVRMF